MQYMDEGNYKFFRNIEPIKGKKAKAELEAKVMKDGKALYRDYREYLANLKRLDRWQNSDEGYVVLMDALNVIQYMSGNDF